MYTKQSTLKMRREDLYENNDINQRWNNFENLINEENKMKGQKVIKANRKEVEKIAKEEIMETLKKVCNKESVGPDKILEVWKALDSKEINILVSYPILFLRLKQFLKNGD